MKRRVTKLASGVSEINAPANVHVCILGPAVSGGTKLRHKEMGRGYQPKKGWKGPGHGGDASKNDPREFRRHG